MWLDIAPSILKGSLNYSVALTWQKNPLGAGSGERERVGADRASALVVSCQPFPSSAIIKMSINIYTACVASRIIIINNFPLCEPLFSRQKRSSLFSCLGEMHAPYFI